ncbi:hypothetical protein N5079_17885 [Planotetraspora sp. A-T 1434]|uniref:putative quinol monooxygenase n=1 Tax=Planotetraspora sp. A-T 1434 TaxID=2979219 RepID=UPI0021C183DB|nr:hypothetical protein [Planotetraspora sp. A-T 1434]MCT9932076.1 hypothetical protein [Planotetraspora sp. A-T 1434]
MEVLVALLAFAGALLAGITTGVLIGRLRDEPTGWLIAWSVTTGALALSLGAIAVGHLTGFGSVTFRAFEITGSLLAPLWLAVGVLQLLAEKASARFGGWLLGIALTVVGVVIMLLDPVAGGFTKQLPDAPVHWDIWPEWLLRGIHVLVIVMLLISLAVALLSWRDGDDYDADNMNATVVLAPAGMALVGALELTLPGIVIVALLAVTAGGIWYAVAKPLAPYEEDEDEDDEWEESGRRRVADRREAPPAPPVSPPSPSSQPSQPSQPSPPSPPAQAPPRRSGLGDLVAEYRAGEEVDYAARMQPLDDFGGPATGQLMAADVYGMPAPAKAEPQGMPATGAVFPGAEIPPEVAASFGVGFGSASRQSPAPAPRGGSVKPSPSIYGLLTVFTLLDGSGEAFDKLAEETVEAVQRNEPDTLVFVCHGVKSAPLQRIVYELYRDEVGFSEHQRQPHMERFATERQPLVLATNVIELTVNAAKVVPLPTTFV